MLCGTTILCGICEYAEYGNTKYVNILHNIVIPQNIVMDLNNVTTIVVGFIRLHIAQISFHKK